MDEGKLLGGTARTFVGAFEAQLAWLDESYSTRALYKLSSGSYRFKCQQKSLIYKHPPPTMRSPHVTINQSKISPLAISHCSRPWLVRCVQTTCWFMRTSEISPSWTRSEMRNRKMWVMFASPSAIFTRNALKFSSGSSVITARSDFPRLSHSFPLQTCCRAQFDFGSRRFSLGFSFVRSVTSIQRPSFSFGAVSEKSTQKKLGKVFPRKKASLLWVYRTRIWSGFAVEQGENSAEGVTLSDDQLKSHLSRTSKPVC